MLLNLEYSLKCDAFIGTLASNWCRLVDEMRCTVGTYVHICLCAGVHVYTVRKVFVCMYVYECTCSHSSFHPFFLFTFYLRSFLPSYPPSSLPSFIAYFLPFFLLSTFLTFTCLPSHLPFSFLYSINSIHLSSFFQFAFIL